LLEEEDGIVVIRMLAFRAAVKRTNPPVHVGFGGLIRDDESYSTVHPLGHPTAIVSAREFAHTSRDFEVGPISDGTTQEIHFGFD
jgi:hypothetical protein